MRTFADVGHEDCINLGFKLFILAETLRQALSNPRTQVILLLKISNDAAGPMRIRNPRGKSGGRAKTFGELPNNGLFLIREYVEQILSNQPASTNSISAVNDISMLCLYAKNNDGTFRTALGDTTHCERLADDLQIIPVQKNTLQVCRQKIQTFQNDTEVIQCMRCDGI